MSGAPLRLSLTSMHARRYYLSCHVHLLFCILQVTSSAHQTLMVSGKRATTGNLCGCEACTLAHM